MHTELRKESHLFFKSSAFIVEKLGAPECRVLVHLNATNPGPLAAKVELYLTGYSSDCLTLSTQHSVSHLFLSRILEQN
jgi:hypothetical protein